MFDLSIWDDLVEGQNFLSDHTGSYMATTCYEYNNIINIQPYSSQRTPFSDMSGKRTRLWLPDPFFEEREQCVYCKLGQTHRRTLEKGFRTQNGFHIVHDTNMAHSWARTINALIPIKRRRQPAVCALGNGQHIDSKRVQQRSDCHFLELCKFSWDLRLNFGPDQNLSNCQRLSLFYSSQHLHIDPLYILTTIN